MRLYIAVGTAFALIAAAAGIPSLKDVRRNTAQRIAAHDYPVETHKVQTEDGYILTVFRIPYSPKLQNRNAYRPVAFLQHGFLSLSDIWIFSGPNNALAFLLADAGYDVWMINNRGNTYSRRHKTLSTREEKFWDFSWHEIAFFDVAAVIDYALATTNQTGVHFIGHSMGCTVYFVLMSLRPEYNAKVKTAHLMGPIAYISHTTSFPATIPGQFLGNHPTGNLFENIELFPRITLVGWVGSIICSNGSPIQPLCAAVVNLIFGWYSTHTNTSVLSDFTATHPAGISSNAYIHYEQEYVSGYFRCYDHGPLGNMNRYKQRSPPDYNVSKIVSPVRMYYSDNDSVAAKIDVMKIARLLPNLVENFRVPYPDWNHMDFVFGLEVKDTVSERIISAADHFEETGEQLGKTVDKQH